MNIKSATKNPPAKQEYEMAWALTALLLTLMVYFPVLKSDFLLWDDNYYVFDNEQLKKFSFSYFFGEYVMGNYHPLTMISLYLDKALFGLKPAGFHFTNLVFHLLNTYLVFRLARKLNLTIMAAFAASALFGLHTLHVESVAWVSERKDVLYAFFFLLATLSFLDFRKTGDSKKYIYALILFVASCLSKAQAVVWPVMILLLDYRAGMLTNRKFILNKIPFFVLSLVFGYVAYKAQQSGGNVEPIPGYGVLEQSMAAMFGFAFYLYKTILPINLSCFYPYPDPGDRLLWAGPLVFFAWIGITIYFALKGKKDIASGMAWFLLCLLPVLQFLPVGKAFAADRYTYVPSIGLFILLGGLFSWYLENNKNLSLQIKGIGLAFLVFFGVSSFARTQDWKNTQTLFEDVIKQYPQVAVAHNNLGNLYSNSDSLQLALKYYEGAIKADSNYFLAWNNAGNTYFKLNQYDKAMDMFDQALRVKPGDTMILNKQLETYSNWAGILAMQKDYTGGLEKLRLGMKMNPIRQDLYTNSGNIYAMQGNMDSALYYFRVSLTLGDPLPLIYENMAYSFETIQQPDSAVKYYKLGASLGSPRSTQWIKDKGIE